MRLGRLKLRSIPSSAPTPSFSGLCSVNTPGYLSSLPQPRSRVVWGQVQGYPRPQLEINMVTK